jgi:hypothetical protein
LSRSAGGGGSTTIRSSLISERREVGSGRRIRTARSVAVAVALLGLAACGGADEEDDAVVAGDTALRLELAEQNGSGQSGTATLTPMGDERTKIVMELSSPPAVPQPAHVHPGSV